MSAAEHGESEDGIGEEVDAERARVLLAGGEVRAIDIRDAEAAGGGHPPGASVVADGDLGEAAESALRDSDLPLLVFGDDDGRAREAAEQLREQGHEAAAVSGGIEAWVSAGGQLQPGEDEEYEGPTLKQPGN
jgi:rhodanese-related sulfurtransferase